VISGAFNNKSVHFVGVIIVRFMSVYCRYKYNGVAVATLRDEKERLS
jgi:hypothetical protein